MKLDIKEKIIDDVFGAVWLAALIMTYGEKVLNNKEHTNVPLKQSDIQKIAQRLCIKTVQPARIGQWCNGDHPQSSYNYLRQSIGKTRRLTKAGEFKNSKEYPYGLLDQKDNVIYVIDLNKSITFGELMDWYLRCYSKDDFNNKICDSTLKNEIRSQDNDAIAVVEKVNHFNTNVSKAASETSKIQLMDVCFIKTNLLFDYYDKEDIFSSLDNNTLLETINKSRYSKYYTYAVKHYSEYLNFGIGTFLKNLKMNNDTFYKKLLNPYGDEKYCKFKINDALLFNKKGLYLYLNEGEVMYIGRCRDNFYNRINAGYGNISPKNCYIDGQATNCHINNIINGVRETVQLWIAELNDNNEISELERKLINKYKPEWNIALK